MDKKPEGRSKVEIAMIVLAAVFALTFTTILLAGLFLR